MKYRIVDTPMYPCRWRILPVGSKQPSNSWTEFFRTIQEAETEIESRGATLQQT